MPSGVRQVTETSPQKPDSLRRPSAAPPAVRRWIQGAVLIVVLGMLAGFGAFRLAQENRESRRIEALRQQLATAKFDAAALNRLIATCASQQCPPELTDEAQ